MSGIGKSVSRPVRLEVFRHSVVAWAAKWAAGAVLMGEVICEKYRGRGVGIGKVFIAEKQLLIHGPGYVCQDVCPLHQCPL